MAKKGGSPHLKRVAAPKSFSIARKEHVWLAKPGPGRHASSISLLVAVRDLLAAAQDAREAKKAIKGGKVLVDGKVVKEAKHPIGLMDVISIPALKASYRAIADSKERIFLKKISGDESKFKYCRIENKTVSKKGKIQVSLHDGRTLLYEGACKVGSSIKLSVPEGKAGDVIELKQGASCFIARGKHAGKLAELADVVPGTSTRESQAVLKHDGKELITLKKYLFPVGKEFQVSA